MTPSDQWDTPIPGLPGLFHPWDTAWIQAAQGREIDARWVQCRHCGMGCFNPAPDSLCHRCHHPRDAVPTDSLLKPDTPCHICQYPFDQHALGKYGCPNCNGD